MTTMSQAIEEVCALYPPGCVSFYGQMTPDPWELAHEKLNADFFATKDPSERSDHCDLFISKCHQLIDAYKRIAKHGPDKATAADAAFVGDPERVKRWQSIKHKQCVKCESTKDLSLHRIAQSIEVVLICAACKTSGYTK